MSCVGSRIYLLQFCLDVVSIRALQRDVSATGSTKIRSPRAAMLDSASTKVYTVYMHWMLATRYKVRWGDKGKDERRPRKGKHWY